MTLDVHINDAVTFKVSINFIFMLMRVAGIFITVVSNASNEEQLIRIQIRVCVAHTFIPARTSFPIFYRIIDSCSSE